MPDHLHLLVIGDSEQSDLREFVRRFKQVTGFAYRREHGGALWQPGYHDRIMRDDEHTEIAARYILANPVRAGLSQTIGEYPFAGSLVYDTEALRMLWARQT